MDGATPKYDLDQFRQIIREIISECGRPTPGSDGMVPARCAGHEELRDIVVEARKEVQHLNDTLIAYMARKDREDQEIQSTVTDLRIFGAPISQENARDIKALKEETLPKIEQKLGTLGSHAEGEERIERFLDTAVARYGIVIMALLGAAGFALDLYSRIKGGT